MLKEKIGEFVCAGDIPVKAVVRRGESNDIVFSIIDTIYSYCYWAMGGPVTEIDNITIVRKNINTAIEQFKLFNILEDVDKLIVNNSKCVASKGEVVIGLKQYINKVSNKYFKYSKAQKECKTILDGVLGEIITFSSSIDLDIDMHVIHNLRITNKQPILISNEITMLKNIKKLFEDVAYNLYLLMQKLYEIGAGGLKAPPIIYDLEL